MGELSLPLNGIFFVPSSHLNILLLINMHQHFFISVMTIKHTTTKPVAPLLSTPPFLSLPNSLSVFLTLPSSPSCYTLL